MGGIIMTKAEKQRKEKEDWMWYQLEESRIEEYGYPDKDVEPERYNRLVYFKETYGWGEYPD